MLVELDHLRKKIDSLARVNECDRVRFLIKKAARFEDGFEQIRHSAQAKVNQLREAQKHNTGVNQLMQEYRLSTQEGVALMCLAEALLRIPDTGTRNALIRDKLSHADWAVHLGQKSSLFANASAWGLFIAGRWLQVSHEDSLHSSLLQLLARSGEGVVRHAVELAVKFMGQQFVAAQTIEQALQTSREKTAKGYTFSFDMLGEAAVCEADSQAYFNSYAHAIEAIGSENKKGVFAGHGISVKLSALHSRYTIWQEARVYAELYPRLYQLALSAKQHNIALNVDAEESERLDLSLDLFTRLAFEPELAHWNGLGLAVQAYQTRATAVIEFIAALARATGQTIQVRLVKGAYWDSEIKRCQVQGLANFPVFTQKVHTDLSYLCCAELMLRNADNIYPQFATHNAHTSAAVQHMASQLNVGKFEMQCLHGMGEGLYAQCRIYAPVGSHHTLLPYLVRRLLENGANTSFVNQLVDPKVDLGELVQHPVVKLRLHGIESNPACTPAPAMFGSQRRNSEGLDLYCKRTLHELQRVASTPWSDLQLIPFSTRVQVDSALLAATGFNPACEQWFSRGPQYWSACLRQAGQLLEENQLQLINLLVHEAKKTIPNAHMEVREAVDFCRYYAAQASALPIQENELIRRVAVCISPWNFPLAIFVGQVTGALASGHSVVAKPAEQTPQIACLAVRFLHQAGVPAPVLQLVHGDAQVGAWLTACPAVSTVLFTGSNVAAKQIERSLLDRDNAGLPALLVAETGGQNAMVVDSSALPEQVVLDVMESAFGSAGQRCSALRVLCVQEEIADGLLPLLKGAMQELQMGDPSCFSTDVGPLIDHDAWQVVHEHIEQLRTKGLPVFQVLHRDRFAQGFFIAPTLVELKVLSELQCEVFGPVLHVLRYKAGQLPALLDELNATGYALTFGIHSRIQSTLDLACNTINAGNVYVNRNMVGAVVGSQPFGGHGKSGTGPKAGGPLYVPTLARIDHIANLHDQTLPGPTGERNLYRCRPRGRVWCTAQQEKNLFQQIDAVLAAGNVAVVGLDQFKPFQREGIEWESEINLEHIDAVVCERNLQQAFEIARRLVQETARVIPIIVATDHGSYPTYRLLQEQLVCTNTAAAGGNVELVAKS